MKMKRIILILTIVAMFAMPLMTAYADTKNVQVNSADATVAINAGSADYSNFKVIIEKDDVEYVYNLSSKIDTFPLQMGSGEYTVTLFGSNDGRRFRTISKETFSVQLDENAVFLSASQTVNWDNESEVAALAQTLTKDAKTDREKLEVIHEYVIHNVSYDYDKAQQLPKGYIPSPEETLSDGSGICYDFAALTASMLRSVNVPTKLVKGYSTFTPVYHAWNEVLVDGEWLVVDTSTDSIFVDYNAKYSLVKNVDDYLASKVY
jgi:transglutaminase-like putative cysteine protease